MNRHMTDFDLWYIEWYRESGIENFDWWGIFKFYESYSEAVC